MNDGQQTNQENIVPQSLPQTLAQYDNQTTIITYQKKSRKRNTTTTLAATFQFRVRNGNLLIYMNGRIISKEPQIVALTVEILKKLLSFMGFTQTEIDAFKNKSEITETICFFLGIITTKALEISDDEKQTICTYQSQVIANESMIENISSFIVKHTQSIEPLAHFLDTLTEQNADLFDYVEYLWHGCIGLFSNHCNDDWETIRHFERVCNSDELLKKKQTFADKHTFDELLQSFAASKDICLDQDMFWYSLNISVQRYFNYKVGCFAIETFKRGQENQSLLSSESKCAAFKFFGSALNTLHRMYKSGKYDESNRDILLSIVRYCLVSSDDSDSVSVSDNQQIPLRIRLVNRGTSRYENQAVFKEMAHRVMTRYIGSVMRRNKSTNSHVGDFRTGLKTICTSNSNHNQ